MSMDYMSLGIILALIGIGLFLLEFLLPAGGALLGAGLLFCIGGVAVIAVNGQPSEALAAVLALCVGVPILGSGGVYFWGKRMALKVSLEDNLESATSMSGETETLKGRVGRTSTPMRPSGAVEFDGRRVDAMTEGMMLPVGVWVRCVDVRGGKVFVRQIPKPTNLDDINLDDLN